MTGHSIRKLRILLAVFAWVILFMGVEQQYTVYTSNSSLRLLIRFFSVSLTSSFHSVPVEERSLQVSSLASSL